MLQFSQRLSTQRKRDILLATMATQQAKESAALVLILEQMRHTALHKDLPALDATVRALYTGCENLQARLNSFLDDIQGDTNASSD